MKSVLLGGLKVFLVNDGGKPLSAPGGRAKFFTANTSTPETVYSDMALTQETALGPEVDTDLLGYLPPIWLKTDRLYKVQVFQRVPGHPEQWTMLWEVDNVGYIDPHESEEPGIYPIIVDSISALKTVDYTAHTLALVLGYYEPGDWGEPSTFRFEPECSKAPDDGAYVLPYDMQQSSDGRWVQQFDGDILDVRKFGALPNLTGNPNVNSDVSGRVTAAKDYMDVRAQDRLSPFTIGFVAPGRYDFVGSFDFRYTWTDLSDNTEHPVQWFIGNDVVFNNISENTTTFTLSKDTVCVSATELVGGNCRLNVEGGGKIVVDPAWWGERDCHLIGCHVKCNSVTDNDKHFENCDVESNGYMGGNVFLEDMAFSEFWLVDGFDFGELTLTDCRYGVEDCRSGDSYVAIKNSQGDPDYGDMKYRYVTNAPLLASTVSMANAIGSVVVSGSGYTNIELDNCTLTVTTPEEPSATQPRLYADNCAITFAGGCDFASVRMRRCSTAGATVKVVGNALFDYCDMLAPLQIHGDLTLKNSTVGASVLHTAITTTLNLVMTNNIVGAQYTMGGTQHNTEVHAIITGNTGTVPMPVVVDRTLLYLEDARHSYSYNGNTGTFIPDVTQPVTFNADVRYTYGTVPANGGAYRTLSRGAYGNVVQIWNSTTFFDNVQFFRIGSDYFKVQVRVVGWQATADSVDTDHVSVEEALVGAYHQDGMTWGIKPYWVNPGEPDSNLTSVFQHALFRGVKAHGFDEPLSDYSMIISLVYENMEKHL